MPWTFQAIRHLLKISHGHLLQPYHGNDILMRSGQFGAQSGIMGLNLPGVSKTAGVSVDHTLNSVSARSAML